MAEVAEAYVSLVPSAKGFKRGIEREIGGDVERAGRSAGAKSGKAFSGAFGGAVKGIGAVVGVGAVVGFFTDSINKASQLEQSVGGVQAVFGKYADSVLADSKKANQALGLSANAYNELITVSAALLKNKGLGDYAVQAKNLVAVGADLSAQFGGSTREAVEALNAAMRGESDPIERYGISLNETAVNAVLAAKGQKDLTGAALEQAKAQARLTLITQQSADAQGAFGREADTMAGQQQRALAQFEDTRAELGQAFLPLMTDMFELLNDDVVPAITGFVKGMKDGTGAGGEFADILGDVKDVGETVVDIVTAIPEPVLKFGTAIGLGAVAIGKMNSAIAASRLTGFITDLGSAETRAAKTSRALQGLGAVGRNVAGAGGMLLLADSTNEVSEEMGLLKGAAGGALSGAALGAFAGPLGAGIGAGIGAVAGGIFSLATNTRESGEAAEEAAPPLERYMSAIEGGAEAITRFNTEQAIKNLGNDAIAAGRAIGILPETLARAAQGSPKAINDVNVALKKAREQIKPTAFTVNQFGQVVQELDLKSGSLRKSVSDVTTALGLNQTAYREDVTEANDAALAVGDYAKVLPGLDREVQTKIALLGLSDARNNIVNLTRLHDLAREDVRTILEATGYVPTRDKITDIINKANELDGTTATVGIGVELYEKVLDFQQRLLGGGKKRSALGNPYSPGDVHLVGERGPELFTSGTRGHITSNNRLQNIAGSGGGTVILRVGEREFTAYMTEQADSRIDAAAQINGMMERAY